MNTRLTFSLKLLIDRTRYAGRDVDDLKNIRTFFPKRFIFVPRPKRYVPFSTPFSSTIFFVTRSARAAGILPFRLLSRRPYYCSYVYKQGFGGDDVRYALFLYRFCKEYDVWKIGWRARVGFFLPSVRTITTGPGQVVCPCFPECCSPDRVYTFLSTRWQT